MRRVTLKGKISSRHTLFFGGFLLCFILYCIAPSAMMSLGLFSYKYIKCYLLFCFWFLALSRVKISGSVWASVSGSIGAPSPLVYRAKGRALPFFSVHDLPDLGWVGLGGCARASSSGRILDTPTSLLWYVWSCQLTIIVTGLQAPAFIWNFQRGFFFLLKLNTCLVVEEV